jgi:hypothetical protein
MGTRDHVQKITRHDYISLLQGSKEKNPIKLRTKVRNGFNEMDSLSRSAAAPINSAAGRDQIDKPL